MRRQKSRGRLWKGDEEDQVVALHLGELSRGRDHQHPRLAPRVHRHRLVHLDRGGGPGLALLAAALAVQQEPVDNKQ